MQTNLAKKTITVIGLLALVIIAITGIIIYPTIRDIQVLNKQTETILAFLEKRSENAQKLRQSLQLAKDIKDEVNGYEKFLFKQDAQLILVTSLEEIAGENNIVQKIENSNLDTLSANKYLELNISAAGEYQNVLNYIRDLEKLDYFININNIRLSSTIDRTSGVATRNVTANIKISLYVSN